MSQIEFEFFDYFRFMENEFNDSVKHILLGIQLLTSLPKFSRDDTVSLCLSTSLSLHVFMGSNPINATATAAVSLGENVLHIAYIRMDDNWPLF